MVTISDYEIPARNIKEAKEIAKEKYGYAPRGYEVKSIERPKKENRFIGIYRVRTFS